MIIRELEEKDAEQYLSMLSQLDQETKNMMYEPGERSWEIDFIYRMIENNQQSGSIILLAIEDEKCVGFLSANRGNYNRIRHAAYIVIGILQEYQGKGLGSALFAELEKWAIRHALIRLELTVMTHNQAGINLYKKNGFEIEGLKKRSILVNNQYVDEYYMAKLL